MPLSNHSTLPNVIYAEASVHSIGGRSVFETTERITSETVRSFHSEADLVDQAVTKLKAHGFEVLNVGTISITIAAPPATYERVFNTSIITKEREVKGIPGKQSTTALDSTNSEMFGLINTANSPLADVLEGVAINERMFRYAPALSVLERPPVEDLHGGTPLEDLIGGTPSARPPDKDYFHLEPPHDLARLLRAKTLHRLGITGQGVHVVMVDSGFYEHPFFIKNHYRYNPVVLGPGASAPEHDEVGHGTGESVNAFSLAPDIDFTMVKMNLINALGAFREAVNLGPDIISCSWGHHVSGSVLSAHDLIFEAEIANAISNGITVVFSTGNGTMSFPGMHPDVISAGGVYVDKRAMMATPYASGYMSNVYHGRQIPDVCGLVGLPPRAAYIMLPVEPGDDIDVDLAGGTHPDGDETDPDDGWAAFSGTSAAAPQLAGICALLKQVNSKLSPDEIRSILMQTARDVTTGSSAQSPAGPGRDLATGYGLAHATHAVAELLRRLP